MKSSEILNNCTELQDLYNLACQLKPQTARLGGWNFYLPDQTDSISFHELIYRLKTLYRAAVKNYSTADTTLKLVDRIHNLNKRGRDLIIPWYQLLAMFIRHWFERFKYDSYHTLDKIEGKVKILLHQIAEEDDIISSPRDSRLLPLLDQFVDLQQKLEERLALYPEISCVVIEQKSAISLTCPASGKSSLFDKVALQSQLGNGDMDVSFKDEKIKEIEISLDPVLYDFLCTYLQEGDVPDKISAISDKLLFDLYEWAYAAVIPRLEIQCSLEILRRIVSSSENNELLVKQALLISERMVKMCTQDF